MLVDSHRHHSSCSMAAKHYSPYEQEIDSLAADARFSFHQMTTVWALHNINKTGASR